MRLEAFSSHFKKRYTSMGQPTALNQAKQELFLKTLLPESQWLSLRQLRFRLSKTLHPASSQASSATGRPVSSARPTNFSPTYRVMTLKAYVAEEGTADAPIKIPFGHQRLTFGLKRTLKAKRGSTWCEYIQMTLTQRRIVDQVTKYAKTQSRHVRTRLGLQQIQSRREMPVLPHLLLAERATAPHLLHRLYRAEFQDSL
jgi:hypothetical protein